VGGNLKKKKKKYRPLSIVNVLLVLIAFVPFITYRYYGVESSTVDWTSLVFMVAYIPLIFPGAWIMDKMVWFFEIIN
jgi:hypothetical protein